MAAEVPVARGPVSAWVVHALREGAAGDPPPLPEGMVYRGR
ncbi:MAG: hypothetical protein V9G10_04995 [Candidatus Nanopelagicales bacterium]